MEGILPGPVVRKKKVGLEMPYSSWLRSELRPLAEEVLSPGSVSGCGLLDPRGVRRLWDDHLAMRVDNGRALWGLLNYMVWHEGYISTRSWRDGLRAADPVEVLEPT